jgi:secreted trypsin-like serine protease
MRKRSLVVGLLAAGATALSGIAAAGAMAESDNQAPGMQPYIVGGEDATEEYSFMASLQQQDGFHFCGGSLIDPEWVLTAAPFALV